MPALCPFCGDLWHSHDLSIPGAIVCEKANPWTNFRAFISPIPATWAVWRAIRVRRAA